jgi:hypothetical protein
MRIRKRGIMKRRRKGVNGEGGRSVTENIIEGFYKKNKMTEN